MLYDGVSSSELGRDLVRYGAVRKVLRGNVSTENTEHLLTLMVKKLRSVYYMCDIIYSSM